MAISNTAKVKSYETWDTATTTWDTETRTWDEMASNMSNTTKNPRPAYGWTTIHSITVASSKVSGTQTDFPVYVDLSGFDDSFFNAVASNGADIRVFKSDNSTEVPYELVAIDTGAQTGQLWFKGDISASADTTFYIHTGNSGASAYAASDTYGSENVWDSDYVMVHHLQGNATDSTANDEDGTISGAVSATGKIGTAYDFDGVDDYIEVAHNANQLLTSGLVIRAWFKADTTGESNGRIIDKSTGTTGQGGFYLRMASSGLFLEFKLGTGALPNPVNSGNDITVGAGRYYRVMLRLATDGTVTYYINGVISGSPAATNAPTNITTTNAIRIGNRSTATDRTFDGVIDEVSLEAYNASKHTGAFALTEYNNQSSPSTFYSIKNLGLTNTAKPSASITNTAKPS